MAGPPSPVIPDDDPLWCPDCETPLTKDGTCPACDSDRFDPADYVPGPGNFSAGAHDD